MAFEETKERYASFGVATSLPHDIIDTFWDLLDNYLKNVVPLDNILTFRLAKKDDRLTFEYHDAKRQLLISFDYSVPFDPYFPEIVNIVDQSGIETILLPHEFD
jgi:hypothetical protein